MEIYQFGGTVGTFKFAGTINCSTNPDYPTAQAGDVYIVSVGGYIGGDPAPSPDNGQAVQAGDFLVCEVDSLTGTHAAVGANWTIIATASATLYTNPTAILAALGGIAIGETFTNQTMQQMWDNLLYPYLGPLVNTVVLTPVATDYYEKGDTITLPLIDTNVTVRSNAFTSLVLSRSGSAWTNVYTLPIVSGAQAQITDPADVTDTTTYTVTANDGVGPAVAETATYTFIYPYFYGSDADGLTGAQIYTNLTKVINVLGADITHTFTPDAERVYFAFPATYGTLGHIYDQNSNDVTADFTMSVVAITGLDSSAQNYNVYKIDHDIGDTMTITFTFEF